MKHQNNLFDYFPKILNNYLISVKVSIKSNTNVIKQMSYRSNNFTKISYDMLVYINLIFKCNSDTFYIDNQIEILKLRTTSTSWKNKIK